MSEPDLVGLFVAPLERLGLEYMVTGGVASVAYGDPRFTRDVDLVLELRPPDLDSFLQAFPSPEFYAPPVEVLAREVERSEGGHFNVIHGDSALRADVYLAGDDPFHRWALARRVPLDVDGTTVRLAPAEYVIVRKLEYFAASGSDRHLRDVAMMLRVSGDRIDEDSLSTWAARRRVSEALRRARDFEVG
ncbi:MAG: nucleotidyl transferase AbiEii/AbiGii toxin family protein [Longimicrobiales bacterium]